MGWKIKIQVGNCLDFNLIDPILLQNSFKKKFLVNGYAQNFF